MATIEPLASDLCDASPHPMDECPGPSALVPGSHRQDRQLFPDIGTRVEQRIRAPNCREHVQQRARSRIVNGRTAREGELEPVSSLSASLAGGPFHRAACARKFWKRSADGVNLASRTRSTETMLRTFHPRTGITANDPVRSSAATTYATDGSNSIAALHRMYERLIGRQLEPASGEQYPAAPIRRRTRSASPRPPRARSRSSSRGCRATAGAVTSGRFADDDDFVLQQGFRVRSQVPRAPRYETQLSAMRPKQLDRLHGRSQL